MSALDISEINKVVGENVVSARKAHGWTQNRLAEISGLNRAVVAKIEVGETVTSTSLSHLADAFGVPVFMFFLRPSDWRKFIKIFEAGTEATETVRRAGDISEEEIHSIEVKSLSQNAQDNKEAVIESKRLVYKLLGIESEPNLNPTLEDRASSSAMGMATQSIPGDPLLNGIIANLIAR